MISASTAYHNLILHQTREPINNLTTISEMIRVSSLLGAEKIEIFISVKSENKIKTKLREAGYLLNTIYTKALPNEILLEITWNTSTFIGETIKEIKNV